MSNIYIQLASGLEKLIHLTPDEITTFLGYIPASEVDLHNIFESDSDEFSIVDKDGNIIATINQAGIRTTDITINFKNKEKSLKHHLQDFNAQIDSFNAHKKEFNDFVEKIEETDKDFEYQVSSIEKQQKNHKKSIDSLNLFKSDLESHIQGIDAETGSDDSFEIADLNGNVVARIDSQGIFATGFYQDGIKVGSVCVHCIGNFSFMSSSGKKYNFEELKTKASKGFIPISMIEGTKFYNQLKTNALGLILKGVDLSNGSEITKTITESQFNSYEYYILRI